MAEDTKNYISYSEKLRNPEWQKKRLEILSRDYFMCTFCGDSSTELHIHHKEYIKGKEPWDYTNDNFQTLCKYCHSIIGYFKNNKEKITKCLTNYNSEVSGAHIVITKSKREGESSINVYFIDFKDDELNVTSIIDNNSITFILENVNI